MRFNTDIPRPWVIEEEETEKKRRQKKESENPLQIPEILPEEEEPEPEPKDPPPEERVVIIPL